MNLTLDHLHAVCQTAGGIERSALYLAPLNKWLPAMAIDTPQRVSCWLAQALVETGEWQPKREVTNYTHAEVLMRTFPHEFPTLAIAAQYVGHPQAIANRAYANRFGNGDEASGDGFRYRGGGAGQLTFLDNYRRATRELGIDLVNHPDLIEEPDAAAGTFALFWRDNNLNLLADAGDFHGITRHVNGPACEGLSEREVYLARCHKSFGIG